MVTFGEPLGHVITLCGQILVSRTGDDLPPPRRVSIQNVPVCRFKTSPCVPAPRAHVFQHGEGEGGREEVVVSLVVFIGKKSECLTHLEHLNRTLGSSLIANFLLTMNGPHRSFSGASEVHQK